METRQLEHEGFEHTNEFRGPEIGEWYQSRNGIVGRHGEWLSDGNCGGKRWILRKIESNPKKEEVIKLICDQLDYIEDQTITIVLTISSVNLKN